MKSLVLILFLALCGGCASYEFDLTQPPELARHIGEKSEDVIDRGPLRYRLQAYDNHLVMRIYNTTAQPIELIGAQSVVVDSQGQSHPLPSQTIAPNSYIKLIFPPMPPPTNPTGPSISFGMNTELDRGYIPFHNYRRPNFEPGYDDPYYLSAYDSGAFLWQWKGETEVRMILIYAAGEKTLRDEFTFKRVKA